MMQVGKLKAEPGEHVFGYLEMPRSRSQLSPDIPVHLFAGAQPGPTFLVQGAIHGAELAGAMAILNFVKRLDATKLRGNVLAVPVVNRMGVECGQRGSKLDGKDISRLFPGDPTGSINDQVAHIYFHEVIRQSNVMLDLHAASRGYERYVLFTVPKDPKNPTEIEQKRRTLAIAFGLDTVAYFPPGAFGGGSKSKDSIAEAGVVQFTTEFGGLTGWHKNGENNLADIERGIWNVLKAMRMVDREFEADGPECKIYNASVILWKPPVDGLFLRKKRDGEFSLEGEIYGSIVDPYQGTELGHLVNTRDSTVIPGGLEWLTAGSTSVGILGVLEEVVDRRKLDLHVSFG